MKITCDGNEAVAHSAQLLTEISSIYPITPSSPMAEYISKWSDEGKENIFGNTIKVVEMQSEAGAAGMLHGSLLSGSLTTTFTASQGLLLMIPNMYKIAGEMLPAVIHVAARTIATHALSIMGDHSDIYSCLNTGFAFLSSSSVQEAHDMALIAHLSAINSNIPFLHFMDGFRTSHELQKIELINNDEVKKIIDYEKIKKFRDYSININNPKTRGTAQNDDIFFQISESRNKYYYDTFKIVKDNMEKLYNITGRKYDLFEYYGSKNPKKIIIAMGSVIETIKEVVDDLDNVGVITVRLLRPFSINDLINVIPGSVESIAVLDRAKTIGGVGEPLYLDVVSALKDKDIKIYGGRYGLSSKNVEPKHIKSVFDFLSSKEVHHNFTVGIKDDITNLSIEIDDTYKIDNKDISMLIYGYGSDGMVSCSKSIIKILGNNTNSYVQGYFSYDSKKSGGLTKSNLRISNDKIRSTYYVKTSDIVVCSKESYLNKYDVLETLKDNSIFLLNTNSKDINKTLNDKVKKIIKNKNIRFYTIDATKISRAHNLSNKISIVMECAIFKISNMINYDEALKKISDEVKKIFSKKGSEVVKNNLNLINDVEDNIILVNNDELSYKDKLDNTFKSMYETIIEDKGNDLPVSAFINNSDGVFCGNTSIYDKRRISEFVPHWIKENCISCNQCSVVCPHGVIKPKIIDSYEYEKLPDKLKENCIPLKGNIDFKYYLDISIKDCTGCMLCVKACPALNKALSISNINKEEELDVDKHSEYVNNNISHKNLFNTNTIRGCAFNDPLFTCSGACSGCGETPYIKLLTQVVGKNLVIANATGCSSIYGGSMPSLPYNVNWANSLFEDNAEFGYGMVVADKNKKDIIRKLMTKYMDEVNETNKELFIEYLEDFNTAVSNKVYDNLIYEDLPNELVVLKEFIKKQSIWTIGGDGWAYDIGFSGIDHVMSNLENSKILILDTEVYSNTGGQASKSTTKGASALFALNGKKTNKKDMIKILMCYPNTYVGTISLGYNMNHTLKVLKEAQNFEGPAIVIAYSPCIAHGINPNLNSLDQEKLAVNSGYFPLIRYNGVTNTFNLDKKEVDFDLLDEFFESERRFLVNKELVNEAKKYIIDRFEYFKNIKND